jgi:hypothetical protein
LPVLIIVIFNFLEFCLSMLTVNFDFRVYLNAFDIKLNIIFQSYPVKEAILFWDMFKFYLGPIHQIVLQFVQLS